MRGKRSLKEDLFRMRDAIDQYLRGQEPVSVHARRARDRRLHAAGPRGSVYEEQGQLDDRARTLRPGQPDRRAGVYNIHSGSDATAIDGTKYAEW